MKALAVYPGEPNSMHLREVEEPYVSDIPEGRGVLVRVGVDGLRDFYQRAGDEAGFAAYLAYLRQRHRRKTSFITKLDKALAHR